MVVLILADSHGHVEQMVQAVERTQPDAICHLGDCWRDGQRLAAMYPHLPCYAVPGNCDFTMEPPRELTIALGGHRVFLCHGDRYGVKNSLSGLAEPAERTGAKLLLFGHTHRPFIDHRYGAMLLNPGSIGLPPTPGAYAYAVAYLEEGKPVNAWLKTLE